MDTRFHLIRGMGIQTTCRQGEKLTNIRSLIEVLIVEQI